MPQAGVHASRGRMREAVGGFGCALDDGAWHTIACCIMIDLVALRALRLQKVSRSSQPIACKIMLHYKYSYTIRGHTADVRCPHAPQLFAFFPSSTTIVFQVRCVASTHVGDLVSASRDCSARVWSSADGKVNQSDCMQLIGHEKFCISCCTIPPCARFPAGAVASCSQDSSIIIWDSGEPAFTLLGHNEQVSHFPATCLLLQSSSHV